MRRNRSQRWIWVCLSWLGISLVAAQQPQEVLPAGDPIPDVTKALQDKLPQVAILKAERFLQSRGISEPQRLRLRHLLSRAHLQNEDAAKALAAVEGLTDAESRFWRAAALQQQGSFAKAELTLAALQLPKGHALEGPARVNHALVSMALQRYEKALELTQSLLDSKDAALAEKALVWNVTLLLQLQRTAETAPLLKRPVPKSHAIVWEYLLGQAALQQANYAAARTHFTKALDGPTNQVQSLQSAVNLGLARAQRLAGQKAEASRIIGTFVSQNPTSPLLHAYLGEFQACNTPPDEEMGQLLESWAASPSVPLAVEAKAALIHALSQNPKKASAALEACEAFLAKHAEHSTAVIVRLRKVQILVALERSPEARSVLQSISRSEQTMELKRLLVEMQAFVSYEESDFEKAAELFRDLAKNADTAEGRLQAAYRSALASVRLGADVLPTLAASELIPEAQRSRVLADLALEQGLHAAAQGEPESARRTLERFANEQKTHARFFEAALALGELEFANAALSAAWLEQAANAATTPEQQSAVHLAKLELSARGPVEAFSKALESYLKENTDTPFAPALQLRLGECFFNAGRYAEAKRAFAEAAQTSPSSQQAGVANFWAGKAALLAQAKDSETEALKYWDAVAVIEHPLRHRARLEQATLDSRRDTSAALQILDGLLKDSPPPTPETRYEALCLRGEILTALPSPTPEQLERAAQDFQAVIASPGASVRWRQQAWFRKGRTLETQQKPAEALEAYYEAMNQPLSAPTNPANPTDADYYWYFRAGEKALALLEAKKDWKGAVSVSLKLAQIPGTRGDAARDKADRLKTEHLLWDEDEL